MKGLLLRLSTLDADAESAVRVIAFFDALVTERASLDALLRATAALAECPVGVEDPRRGISAQAQPDTWAVAGPATRYRRPLSGASPRPTDGSASRDDNPATVWLERAGSPLPLDEIVLERFAIASTLVLHPVHAALPEMGDPALVELVLGERTGDVERARALHLLGVPAGSAVQAVAVAAGPADPAAGTRVAAAAAGGRRALGAHVGDQWAAVLVDTTVPTDFVPPAGVRVGVGEVVPATYAPRSWHTARIALRFTSTEQHGAAPPPTDLLAAPALVRWPQLGALALLAEHIPSEAAGHNPDVAVIDALTRERGGPVTLATLQVLVATGSIRQAATRLHMHHSSVAARLARAQAAFGFPLDTPTGRLRLATALILGQLRDTAR
ncbi:MAG TPA: helix-turn-helix domain-containing protein [Rugosimonospora sp.]|nr:helix-turn-helix domain-containing protein [Rugosimonospora sp.]